MIGSQTSINPAAYKPLLDLIAKGESTGNYNAYFSKGSNTEIRFTAMTLEEVLAWQQTFVEQGSASNAVGRYQIIRPTLVSLIDELGLDLDTRFNEILQDKLAIALMERRGSISFIKGDVSKEEFAHNLSKEWAALPKVIGDAPEQSYYAGDGLNHSRVAIADILQSVDRFKFLAQETK